MGEVPSIKPTACHVMPPCFVMFPWPCSPCIGCSHDCDYVCPAGMGSQGLKQMGKAPAREGGGGEMMLQTLMPLPPWPSPCVHSCLAALPAMPSTQSSLQSCCRCALNHLAVAMPLSRLKEPRGAFIGCDLHIGGGRTSTHSSVPTLVLKACPSEGALPLQWVFLRV